MSSPRLTPRISTQDLDLILTLLEDRFAKLSDGDPLSDRIEELWLRLKEIRNGAQFKRRPLDSLYALRDLEWERQEKLARLSSDDTT
jgi:hypothetical protein